MTDDSRDKEGLSAIRPSLPSRVVAGMADTVHPSRSMASLAHRLLARDAAITGATRLIPITRAHIDGCPYHGPASLDVAHTMAESGARVSVPTTLSVSEMNSWCVRVSGAVME
ncbi:MAG: DUF521 domain-containing protein [Gemmatimonadaceae bacterium]|nr:DUF521 domain-containing protein [Gemmatimonadaceae bacterium]